MADDVIFDNGDRVKIIKGKLKGKKGYVRYVGKVDHKAGIHVGIELDAPDGKHNGTVKGKRYFKCRDRYGYLYSYENFELFGKSKKKLLNKKPKSRLLKGTKSSKGKNKLRKTKSSRMTPTPSPSPTPGKKGDKKKKSKKSKQTPTPTPEPKEPKLEFKINGAGTGSGNNDNNLSLNVDDILAESHPSTPKPIITQITYTDQSCQTEIQLAYVNDDNDIASVSKEVASAHANMVNSLKKQIDNLNKEINELKLNKLKIENISLSKNDTIELLTIEKEALNEDIENLKQTVDENNILIETLQLDIDELKEEKTNIINEYAVELEIGQKNINQIIQQNNTLKETIALLKKECSKELSTKNQETLNLSLKIKRIPGLEKHISELENELKRFTTIEDELNEFKQQIDLNLDTNNVIEILSTKNVELEYELKILKSKIKYYSDMELIWNDIEKENEEYIFELKLEAQSKDDLVNELNKKYLKAKRELKHSQQTVFQFKDHIRKLEDSKRKMSLRENKFNKTKKDIKYEKEILYRTNIELLDKLNLLKCELINYSRIAAAGFSNSCERLLLQKHIPIKLENIDYSMIKYLGFLQRIGFKVKFCKEILESFYIAAESTVSGDIAQNHNNTDADIKETYKVLELCPILIKQERFIQSIQQALIGIPYMDKFNDAVTCWSSLLDVEDKYNQLLNAVEHDNIRNGISISDIFTCNDIYRSYITKLFAEYNPEQKYRSKEKIDKWGLYEVIQQLKYTLYTMTLKTRQINDIIIELSTDDKDIDNLVILNDDDKNAAADDDDNKVLMNGSFSGNVNKKPKRRQLLLDVLQKIEELQSHLTEIVRRTLQYCVPTHVQFFGANSNIVKLRDENYTGIEFDFIEKTAQWTRSMMSKEKILFDNLNKIDSSSSLSINSRIGKINRLLDEESEASSFGLIPTMESLYKHLKGLPYALEQLYKSKGVSSDHDLTAIALGQVSTDKLYYLHLQLEEEIALQLKQDNDAIMDKLTDPNMDDDIIIGVNKSTNISDLSSGDHDDDLRTKLFGKQILPWIKKANNIRNELAQSDIIRDALASANAELKYKHKELILEKRETQTIKARLDVVKLELAKQRTVNQNLFHFEVEASKMSTKLNEQIKTVRELKRERNNLITKNSELNNSLNSYKNTVKEMKLASASKIRPLSLQHDDDDDDYDDDNRSVHSVRSSSGFNFVNRSDNNTLRRTNSAMGLHSHAHHHRANTITLTPASFINNSKLGLTGPSSSYESSGAGEEKMIINQLHKQLDLNKKYNKLLEKTINSLRHQFSVYDLNKNWLSFRKDLKPLPSFTSINNSEYKLYIQRKEHLKHKKHIKKLKKERKRIKLLALKRKTTDDLINDVNNISTISISLKDAKKEEKDDDDDDNDDDIEEDDDNNLSDINSDDNNDDDDNKSNQIDNMISSFEQKKIQSLRYSQSKILLNQLDIEFGEIYSSPQIVDLKHRASINNITYNQSLIGRNIKLRDLKLKCLNLEKECKNIQNNFNIFNKNDFNKKKHISNTVTTNLVPIGRIDIASASSNNNNNNDINTTKVCLNRNNVIKLQNYLNVI